MIDLTEDERELLQLLKEYGEAVADARIWPMSGDQCRIDGRNSVILVHYRTAKAEAVHKEQERIEAEIRALAPRGLYRNVLDLAKQIGRRMSGCKVRAASEAVTIALETKWDDSADDPVIHEEDHDGCCSVEKSHFATEEKKEE